MLAHLFDTVAISHACDAMHMHISRVLTYCPKVYLRLHAYARLDHVGNAYSCVTGTHEDVGDGLGVVEGLSSFHRNYRSESLTYLFADIAVPRIIIGCKAYVYGDVIYDATWSIFRQSQAGEDASQVIYNECASNVLLSVRIDRLQTLVRLVTEVKEQIHCIKVRP